MRRRQAHDRGQPPGAEIVCEVGFEVFDRIPQPPIAVAGDVVRR